MTWVVGVDGCRGGWVAVALRVRARHVINFRIQLVKLFEEVLYAWADAAAIAVDMPIGLWEEGRARARPCDRIARAVLGIRASTVFIPPTRAMLAAPSYSLLRHQGLSVQAYNLIPRIRELDTLMTPDLQQQVWESHPELSFSRMVHAPIPYPKRTQAGKAARRAALYHAFGGNGAPIEHLCAQGKQFPPVAVGEADILDACALSWSAWQHVRGESSICIGEPERDRHGLLMAIRY